jgi:hypothetical protein
MKPVTALLVASALSANVHRDAAGFQIDLPPGWQTAVSAQGHIVAASPNPLEYVFVQPQLSRTLACADLLRQTLTGPGSKYSGVEQLEIQPAGRGVAVARFVFQRGQARGAILCAETSSRAAMYYGMSAPADQFGQRLPVLVGVLKSFSYTAKAGRSSGDALPPLTPWMEPHERAFAISVPQGWQTRGGVARQDATHYTVGVDVASPDGGTVIRLGDARAQTCSVPGPGAPQHPTFCRYQSGPEFARFYFERVWAPELGIQVGKADVAERPDLAQNADAAPRSLGLRVQTSTAEIRYQGTRQGRPVGGALLAQTTLFFAAPGQSFLVGTLAFDVRGYVAPAEAAGAAGRLAGVIHASMRINPDWWALNQRISREIAQRTLAIMQQSAERQQEAFWDRMAAAGRRADATGDLLSGTVRLTDGAGNQYQAQAGSNYYFLDTDAAKTAGRPDDAVRRSDLWPSPLVDLRPLEVIR